jgi:hypothetical protein
MPIVVENDVVAEAKAYCERVRTDAMDAGQCADSYELSLIGSLYGELARVRAERDAWEAAYNGADGEYRRLHALIHSPHVIEFTEAEILEAAYQQETWGADDDAGKTDADWFWLIGYLAGKALHNPGDPKNPDKKRLHRIITIAAAARNWHGAVLGKTNMRPGIALPKGENAGRQAAV